MKNKLFHFLLIITSIAILHACYPDQEIYPEETDTIYTTYLPGTAFYNMEYYIIHDEILRIDTTDLFENYQYDASILARIESNLNSRGYKNAANLDSNLIDFSVVVSDISRLDIAYYWEWLPYGYLYQNQINYKENAYYPLPPPSNISVLAVNGLMVDFLDYPYEADQDSAQVIWRGLSNGIQLPEMESRILFNIDKMFIQSPYLKSNQ